MKRINLSDDQLEHIVKKVVSEQLTAKGHPLKSFGYNMDKKPTNNRKIKVDYMVDRLLNRFLEIAEQHGEDLALEVLEELKEKLNKKFFE